MRKSIKKKIRIRCIKWVYGTSNGWKFAKGYPTKKMLIQWLKYYPENVKVIRKAVSKLDKPALPVFIVK
jgi:hypothetical protein